MREIRFAARTLAAAVCLSFAVSYAAPNAARNTSEHEQPNEKRNVAGPCSPDGFPTRTGNPISCCQDGNRTWHTNDGKTLVLRIRGTPCTEADGVGTNCSGRECTYGPCGSRVEWAVTAKEVHIFRPNSKPETCGWEANDVIACKVGCDWPEGAVRRHPEAFVGQKEYPGVTAACLFTDCLKGGIPKQ
jgi:hypothetical protein